MRMKLFMRDVDAAIEKDKNKGRTKRPSQPPVIHIAHELRGNNHNGYEIEEKTSPLFAKVKLEPAEDAIQLFSKVKQEPSEEDVSDRLSKKTRVS